MWRAAGPTPTDREGASDAPRQKQPEENEESVRDCELPRSEAEECESHEHDAGRPHVPQPDEERVGLRHQRDAFPQAGCAYQRPKAVRTPAL